MMSYTDFRRLLLSASGIPDVSAYIAEEGGSLSSDELQLLPVIHQMASDGLSFVSIRAASGIPAMRLYASLGIPSRTAECWAKGDRKPPEWQLPLIAYAVLSLI